ncbi:MAG: LytTR family transcriptional regulator DNA-binding domain-containing protein [Lachnospiraceae bacterium]|nr:LytTR family transcriptional regulator DNA-binding domain-containing protein [Lachnospiraceae bacterium]
MAGNRKAIGEQITLRINRKETQIPLENIMYAQVTDKLCTIYLYGEDTPPVRIFLTINALKEMLPEDSFVQISRSCLISLHYFQKMNDSEVFLPGDVHIPYSRTHRTEIRNALQKYMAAYTMEPANPEVRDRLLNEFHGFDHFPLPFCIVENVPGRKNMPHNRDHDYIFRYVNDAFASFANAPAYQLINASFFSIFENPDSQWADVFSQCSLKNQQVSCWLPSTRTGTEVRVFCYQPYFSFCACMLTELDREQSS